MNKGNAVYDYGWTSSAEPRSCNYVNPVLLSVLRSLPGKDVLDLGCGNGNLCGLLARSGYQVTGIEPDRKGFELAQAAYPNIRFFNIGVHDDPMAVLEHRSERFDIVVSTEVIEHLYSPSSLLHFVNQTLKRNGCLVLTTPYHGYLKNLILSVLNKWDVHHTALWEGGHIKFWSRKTLGMLLEANGFDVAGFRGIGRIPYLWKSMLIIAMRG